MGFSVSFLICAFFSIITVVPKIQSLDNKLVFASLIICLYFLVILLRTHAIYYQTKHELKQTFDRACPEWITLLSLISLIVGLFLVK
jgi:Ca2+/H+ antiporter